MRVTFAVAAAMAGLAISTAVSHAGSGSAELIDVSGKVLVNVGKGYVPAKSVRALEPGFEVFVSNEAGATLHFLNNKCDVVLAPASITRIGGLDMCDKATRNSATFHGTNGEIVITPVNGTIIPVSGAPAGVISPYKIAGGIFLLNGAAFINSVLEKDAPVSKP